MIELQPGQVTSEHWALFRPEDPAGLRCFAVLAGTADGRVMVDRLDEPTWGIVQEAGFGSIYLGGQIDGRALGEVMAVLQAAGEVLVGLPTGDDSRRELLPPDPDYFGHVLEFSDRLVDGAPNCGQLELPAGCQLRCVDVDLLERCLERDLLVRIFGNAEKALKNSFGLCLVRGDQILSEAHAGLAACGLIEIGTMTPERYRYRGYATLTCAHLIHICERKGYNTYWNCAKHNKASLALARKLGFRSAREYELRAWFRSVQRNS